MAFGLKIFLLLVTAFLIRPTALGQDYSVIGIASALGALFFHLLDCRFNGAKKIELTDQTRLVMALTLIFFGYLLGHAMLMNSIQLNNVLSSMVTHYIIIFAAALILSDASANKLFFKSLTGVFLFFVISYYITFILSIFIPLDSLELFKLNIGNYENSGRTYIPFTILYGVYTVESFELPRLLGLFRESGILQMFLIWSLFNLNSIGLNKIWVKVVLIVGTIASFSTAGLAILFVNFVLSDLLNKKIIRAFLLICITYLVVFYAPFIGLNAKSETHASSITDRTTAVHEGLKMLQENPLGIGMYNTSTHNTGINLMAASFMIGIIGLVLIMLVYYVPMLSVQSKKQYILAVTPIVLTSLISQPLLDAPLIYIMLMAPYIGMTKTYTERTMLPLKQLPIKYQLQS